MERKSVDQFKKMLQAKLPELQRSTSQVRQQGQAPRPATLKTKAIAHLLRNVVLPELSSPSRDTHPTISRDGLEIFISSNRIGAFGGIDLWVVARRATTHDALVKHVHLGSAVNKSANERAP